MELTDVERKLIDAKRQGARIEVSFLSKRSKESAENLIATIFPPNAEMEHFTKNDSTWYGDYSGNAEFDLVVFYDKEENVNE